ncbi:MAG: type I methionyl aminopeptidase [bacterium]|nr:type I methionyl aminopeptidase [bacterium]
MIKIKTLEEIEVMAENGKILARIMRELECKVRPGITTRELDELAEELIFKSGGKCSFKGYENFPACLCTSINEEIVHAIPSKRILKEGDILSLDLGICYKDFHSDMAVTLPVGKINHSAEKLIEATKKALQAGIEKVKPGNCICDISRAIQTYAESQGYNVIHELCGHGIGRRVHEPPQILNSVFFGKAKGDERIKIKEGMVLCLEPMLSAGDWRIKQGKDGSAYETKDGSLSCHFEHTVAVLKDGAKVLTVLE